MAKRIFDLIFAALGLVVLLPFFVIVGILIKMDSKGPVFYRGVRTACKGTRFRIIKFRTMYAGMEKPGGDTTAFQDPRITPFGKFLRRFKLDEFPQLFNVILGEMSLVGPRPELPAYTDQYDEEEKLILSVKPGITDFSSLELISLDEEVGSKDPDAIFEKRILKKKNALRLKYVYERSFWVDLVLIFRTAFKLLSKFKPSRSKVD